MGSLRNIYRKLKLVSQQVPLDEESWCELCKNGVLDVFPDWLAVETLDDKLAATPDLVRWNIVRQMA